MKAEVAVNLGEYDVTRLRHQYHVIEPKDWHNERENKIKDQDADVLVNGGGQEELYHVITSPSNDMTSDEKNYVTLVNIPRSTVESNAFSSELLINQFSEQLNVSSLPLIPQKSCASLCLYESEDPRCKQGLHIASLMTPIQFKESMILLRDCTKRRYKSTIDCWPKVRPSQFSETCYAYPRHMKEAFVSYLDYKTHRSDVRYQSALELIPRTWCNARVENFDFIGSEGSVTDQSEYEDDDDLMVGVSSNGGVLNGHVKATLDRGRYYGNGDLLEFDDDEEMEEKRAAVVIDRMRPY